MTIQYHKHFEKKYARLPNNSKKKTKARILLFTKDPYNRQLKNHPLTGKYDGYRSIDITGDLRAVFKVCADGTIIFATIGTHSELYQ